MRKCLEAEKINTDFQRKVTGCLAYCLVSKYKGSDPLSLHFIRHYATLPTKKHPPYYSRRTQRLTIGEPTVSQ